MALHRDLRLVNHVVPEDMDGTTVGDLDLPGGVRVVAQADEDAERFAEADTALAKGDHLFFLSETGAIKKLNKLFEQKS